MRKIRIELYFAAHVTRILYKFKIHFNAKTDPPPQSKILENRSLNFKIQYFCFHDDFQALKNN